jgi:hypothetical protein
MAVTLSEGEQPPIIKSAGEPVNVAAFDPLFVTLGR